MKRHIKKSSILVLVLLVFTGCSQKDGGTGKLKELTIVSADNNRGVSLDPAAEYQGSRNVQIGVGETLLKINEKTLEVEPYLAKSFEQVTPTSWKFELQDNIKFSNGKPLTGEAVAKSLSYTFASIVRVATMMDFDSVTAEGNTVTIQTKSEVITLPRILTDNSLFIFDVDASNNYEQGVVGTGPYVLETLDAQGNSTLLKNETYWQGEPGFDKVHTKFLFDPASITQAIQSGEIDHAIVQNTDVDLFENNKDFTVQKYENGRVYFLYINDQVAFTQDPKLREALMHTFDKKAYLSAIYGNKGEATDTIFPLWSDYSNASTKQLAFDLEKAKTILKDAGYVDTDGDGFVEKDGKKVVLQITTYASNGFDKLVQAIQGSLKEVGLDSEILVSEKIGPELEKGTFNIATYGYTTLTMGDVFNFMEPVFKTDGTANFNKFSNPKVDALLQELRHTAETQKRKEISIEMQKEIYPANEHAFLLHPSTYLVSRSSLKNVSTNQWNYSNFWKMTE